MFKKCVSSNSFINYENIRNKEYHCLRQEYLYMEMEKRTELIFGKVCLVCGLLEEIYPLIENLVSDEEIIVDKRIKSIKEKIKII